MLCVRYCMCEAGCAAAVAGAPSVAPAPSACVRLKKSETISCSRCDVPSCFGRMAVMSRDASGLARGIDNTSLPLALDRRAWERFGQTSQGSLSCNKRPFKSIRTHRGCTSACKNTTHHQLSVDNPQHRFSLAACLQSLALKKGEVSPEYKQTAFN